jgi:hypothetical protein
LFVLGVMSHGKKDRLCVVDGSCELRHALQTAWKRM